MTNPCTEAARRWPWPLGIVRLTETHLWLWLEAPGSRYTTPRACAIDGNPAAYSLSPLIADQLGLLLCDYTD
jgi:hypothetical protein